jgi:phosphohistidine phosphatase SixA
MLLYLRHGDDRGDDVYRHDRPLNERGLRKAEKAAGKLIEKLGHPDAVYVSPYRRGLETLAAMQPRFTRDVAIYHEPRIAQRLSEKQRSDPKIHPATLAVVDLDRDASTAHFRMRIAAHVDEARKRPGAIWCITHQAVIEEVAMHFEVKIEGSLDFLDHVVMLP